eukprot:CAMPEP_0167789270 /NCGR_PEP_ID=MMETSP0111_2-20121227/10580_1 /TAXON_ID=91324 /ORGANISM="Lotharella globosa, Strain CCCM811" /LENGTH=43 /DNA_ID= /DNA_START= /DNA_END= /DNA_ORIENTATION=
MTPGYQRTPTGKNAWGNPRRGLCMNGGGELASVRPGRTISRAW